MPRKKPSTLAPPESELADAVNRLADVVTVLADIVSLVRADVDWVINNWEEFTRNGRDARESPDSPSRETRSTTLKPETIACSDCDAPSPASLAAALFEGWTEIAPDQGESWNFIGLCPDCLESEYSAPTPTRKATAADLAPDETLELDHPKDVLF